MKQIHLTLYLSILLLFFGCVKEPGEGGSSSIVGKVLQEELSASGSVDRSYYIAEERVYLVYGDDDFYGQEVRTHHDGTYRFDYLNKGVYQIYAYSDCSTCLSKVEPIILTVTIEDNGDEVVLEDLVIKDF